MANELLNAALGYGARRWRVFPICEITPNGGCSCALGIECDKAGKHPAVKQWNKLATTDPVQITAWWGGEYSRCGIGIATGEGSGITVLDVDGDVGVESLAKLQGGAGMPPTPTVTSRPGRFHYYFKFNPAIKSNANKLGEKLDTRGAGGYVVAPPSRHSSGSVYKWLVHPSKQEVAPWPEFLTGGAEKKKAGRPAKEKFNPASPGDVAKLTSALEHIDPDDEEKWSMVGWILGRAYRQSDEGFAKYSAWAAKSRKYDAKRTRAHYYERSKETRAVILTTGSIYKWAEANDWDAPPAPEDGDHYQLAMGVLNDLTATTGHRPIYAMGAFWTVDANGIWIAQTLEKLSTIVAEKYHGYRYCKRASEFKAVAQVAANLCEDAAFFESAAIGIASPDGFHHVTDKGEIKHEALTAAHRQRMRVVADPEPKRKPRKMLRMLEEAFAGYDAEGQIHLLQQLVGCAITRTLWRQRIVALLLGATSTGKSTMISVLKSAFPADQVAAISPAKWHEDYFVAELAGKALNVVGELDAKDPIPAGQFKAITGRDTIQGRHPHNRPFSYVCQAAHFFNANKTPPTNDHSDAFFRRWRVVYFANTVPDEREVIDLDEQIIKEELGAFLWWALNGAAEVARAGHIIETQPHQDKLAKWRVGNNSALAFVLDPQECERVKDASTSGQAAFEVYRRWASDNGYKALGRNSFYEALIAGAGSVGIGVVERHKQITIEGLKILKAWMNK